MLTKIFMSSCPMPSSTCCFVFRLDPAPPLT
jgi:hypothetical protein